MRPTAPTDVSLEKVDAVFALEASRLSRSCSDWHRLLEICAFTDTLLISRVRLKPPAPPPNPTARPAPEPQTYDQQRHRIGDQLRIFREQLGRNDSAFCKTDRPSRN